MDEQARAQNRAHAQTHYWTHREQVLAKRKEEKPWLSYYERNKEKVKARVAAYRQSQKM